MESGAAAPEPGNKVKPFTPEEANEIVMSLKTPAVFCNMTSDWPGLHWKVSYLAKLLDGKKILFRIGKKNTDKAPLFETECSYTEATLDEFLAWSGRQPSRSPGPFCDYDVCQYWTYADYKYIAKLFEDKPEHFQDIIWSDFGFSGRNGRESTLWIGSSGANTPCHLDSYGCNLVLQVQGRKRWHLFPPEDSSFLSPTRIPYEESSVFSRVNVVNPDLRSCPQFKKAEPHIVTLAPGQVLFVPRHWWHYVESIDPITVSINSWIELDVDHEARVEEAITRTLICAIKSAENPGAPHSWLNPTEVEVTSHETNLQYLNRSVSAYSEHQKTSKIELGACVTHDVRETLEDQCKKRKIQIDTQPEDVMSKPCECNLRGMQVKSLEKIPFGQCLLPVLPQSQETNLKGTAECDNGSLLSERHLRKSDNAGKESGTDGNSRALLEVKEPACSPGSPQTAITTNDLLDCVLNPQVVHLVARLLLERAHLN